MFGYYLQLAWRSFRRNKFITALMVMTIAFGVAASMTTWAVFHAVSGDPIPAKSAELFFPQVDNWGPAVLGPHGRPPPMLDYTDAINLMRAGRARYQSAIYTVDPTVVPPRAAEHPFSVLTEAVSSQFFPMVDAPFQYGASWSKSDDTGRARVAVINAWLNDKLFGGADSVGKTIDLGGSEYVVSGVLEAWNPRPRFYDLPTYGGAPFNPRGEGVFIPFTTAVASGLQPDGIVQCSPLAPPPGASFASVQRSECGWISFMVQLDGARHVVAYKAFLDDYARQQQRLGRFNWPPNNRMPGLMRVLELAGVVPGSVTTSLLVALGLLLVCLVNTAGLLLAKFTRRAGEIGVRRALGASRRAIYLQFLVEAGAIGLAGGVVGLILTSVGMLGVRLVMPPDIAAMAHINVLLLGLTVLVAVVAALIAGLYPAFRAAHVQPAWQIKVN
ncbi:MAG TPA: ABC transporter permease [Rhodanobacteraceae bacterium]